MQTNPGARGVRYLIIAPFAAGILVSAPRAVAQSGGVGQPGQLAPKFEQFLWHDLFGVTYRDGMSFLFLAPEDAEGIRPLAATYGEGDPIEPALVEGSFEEFIDLPSTVHDPESATVEVDHDGVDYTWNVTLERSIVAGEMQGTTGQAWIIVGYAYNFSLDLVPPLPSGTAEITILFPLTRHLDELDAVDFALDHPNVSGGELPPPPDDDYCLGRLSLCTGEAWDDFVVNDANCDGIDWIAVAGGSTAGGTIGAGVGVAVGVWFFGAGAVPSGAIGGAVGAFAGGAYAEADSDQACRDAAWEQYRADMRDCDASYDFCTEFGEWPE